MTTYDKWIDDRITYFTKFEQSLFMTYYLSDGDNKARLRNAFPEYFIQDNDETITIIPPNEPREWIRQKNQ
ncbi:hypothetical protein [Emticicia fontis]